MNSRKNWLHSGPSLVVVLLLILLVSCTKGTTTIDDLCPGPILSTKGVHYVREAICDGITWQDGDLEKEFCEWVKAVDLQQEELKVFHEYRSMLEEER